jgi:hypothetical protein
MDRFRKVPGLQDGPLVCDMRTGPLRARRKRPGLPIQRHRRAKQAKLICEIFLKHRPSVCRAERQKVAVHGCSCSALRGVSGRLLLETGTVNSYQQLSALATGSSCMPAGKRLQAAPCMMSMHAVLVNGTAGCTAARAEGGAGVDGVEGGAGVERNASNLVWCWCSAHAASSAAMLQANSRKMLSCSVVPPALVAGAAWSRPQA